MPYGGRNQQRMQAKISRITGQLVYLLIAVESAPTTDTPLSISSVDTSVDLTTAKKIGVYATVRWQPDKFSYDEGGRTLSKCATVEIPCDWASLVVKAYAVQMPDGEVLIKKTEALNESQTFFSIEVESQVSTQE